jgi:uncharacterized protein YabE (DUF348 family)/3D (Asp-Asp-Asp) domain-containing protein
VLIVLGLGVFGALVALLAVLLVRAQMVTVTVVVDGDARQTMTRAATVGDLLNEIGLTLGTYDISIPAPETPLEADLVIRIEKARAVTLNVDGVSDVFWTPLSNPSDILSAAGISVTAEDRILVDGTRTEAVDLAAWPVPVSHITLRRSVDIRILDGDNVTTVNTTGSTVGDALFDAGITLYLADEVEPGLTTPIEDEMEVTLYRSRPVSIIVDGEVIETRTQGERVVDALADAGVALVGLDYAMPGEDAPLQAGMHVRVIRVREEVISEESPLDYETVYQADSNAELDQRTTLQVGQRGVQQTRIRVRYENGTEISREVEETVVVTPPQNHVIGYGTKVVIRTIDTPDGPREYWRVLRMYTTSYHPAALGGDNITATGRVLVKGIIGVYRPIIPFGTELYVPGYGVGLAADTGPARGNGMWIDLGYSDEDWEHWARYTQVYILTPVPAEIDYILPG